MSARATLGSLLPARENPRTFTRSAARAAFSFFAAVLVLLVLTVVPAAPVDASLPSAASTALSRPSLAEASAGLPPSPLTPSSLVASRLDALVTAAGDENDIGAARFSFAASVCLPVLLPLRPLELPELGSLESGALQPATHPSQPLEPESLGLPAQSLSAPLPEAENRRPGHRIYGGWECGCEITYALNNPLRYVDPDGRAPKPPSEATSAVGSMVFSSLPGAGEVHDAAAFGLGVDIVTLKPLTFGDRMWSGLALVLPFVGGAVLRRMFTADQDALIKLAREAKQKKGGVTPEQAEILKEWGEETGLPTRGPETHPDRPHGKDPHIHVGPENHIPVKPDPGPPKPTKPTDKPPCPNGGGAPCLPNEPS